jgi:hypothetical protein
MSYEVKTPVKTNTDKFTGYTYIVQEKDTILARCNSETVADAIATTINDAPRLQAIEVAVREYVARKTGVFNRGHGVKVAFCDICRHAGETLDPASIKHASNCLAASLSQPGDVAKG